MKITIPSIKIEDHEGFSPEKDIFVRKEFGERLAKQLTQTDDEFVVALDAGWGEGKSTFIKMWKGYVTHHREQKIRTIYFDAFSNDYQKDPFVALAAEIYDLLKDNSTKIKDDFITKAGAAANALARGAVKIAVRVGTNGVLDGSVIDSVKTDVAELVANQVDEVFASRLKNSSKDKKALKDFREYLEDFAKEQGGGQPIVFVIDELDRCRPDFALELMEQIKHLFSVRGITFLLVMNRAQMEESIKTKYGIVDASKYLQKFVHLWLAMPRKAGKNVDHGVMYVDHVMKSMLMPHERFIIPEATGLIVELVRTFKPSFREIERMLSYFALIQNSGRNGNYHTNYQLMLAFISYVKVIRPELIQKIVDQKIDSDGLLKEVGLDRMVKDKNSYIGYLSMLVIFDMGNDEQRRLMNINKEIHVDNGFARYADQRIMQNICRWLGDMNFSG